ncbi:MAG: glycosyltransferase family 4 protein [Candidatus Omnitrophota bacterium]
MKIGIDTQSTCGEKTGIGYYTKSLIEEFERIGNVELKYYSDRQKTDLNTLERMYWENMALPSAAVKDKIDLLHIPGFAGPRMKGKFKKVTTINDLIGMIYPQNLNRVSRFYWQRWLPACAKNSDAIIAISEHTKRDIVKLLGVPEEKIHVILLAADSKFYPIAEKESLEKVRQKYDLPHDFMLHLGTIEPRKNITGLVEAFAGYVLENDPDLHLVLAGKKDWGYEQVYQKLEKLNVSSWVKFIDYVDDADMSAIYNLAKFFVYPSFYEGFGLPVLEAMACGTAVICSNTSSLPEVVGDAAILIDPNNIGELKEKIRELDTNASLRAELSERAIHQAGKFSWKKTAEQTLEVYKKL